MGFQLKGHIAAGMTVSGFVSTERQPGRRKIHENIEDFH
jgi:hypothetical protein